MKYVIAALMLLNGVSAFSQTPVDSLVLNKKKMLEKFIPFRSGKMSYHYLQMEPEAFVAVMDKFKVYAKEAISTEKDAELKKKDIDAYARLMTNFYLSNYGLDSIKDREYDYLIVPKKFEGPAPDSVIKKAERGRFVKKLSDRQKNYTDSVIMQGWDINDSALFRYSKTYRELLSLKLFGIDKEEYYKPNGITIKQTILNEKLGRGYAYEYFSYNNANAIMDNLTDAEPAVVHAFIKNYLAKTKNTFFNDNIRKTYNYYKAYANGSLAPSFTYKDNNGKDVSLSSFRGKYVYIDLWATWCMPCIREIPHLKKLEEEYAGKNISFVSISVDEQKDTTRWIKTIASQKMSGVQLIVDKDFESDFLRKFIVNSIPRFILIDPKGKIVDRDAPRPSEKEIKEKLDKLVSVNKTK